MPLEFLLSRIDLPDAVRDALRAEMALRTEQDRQNRESLARLQSTIDAAGVAVYRRDHVRNAYTHVSAAIETLTGIPPEQFTPRTWDNLFRGTVPTGAYAGLPYEEAFALHRANAESVWTADYRLRLADGQERWLACSSVDEHDGDGRTVASVGLLWDVTERYRAAQTLSESEHRYLSVFQASSDSMLLLDAATAQVLDANHVACETYGYSREEFVGLDLGALSADRQASLAALSARLTHVPLRYHRRRDGSTFAVDATASYFQWGERPVCLVGVRDITVRRQVEERLELALDGAEIGLWHWDERTDTLDYGERWAQLVGCPPDELHSTPRRWQDRIHPDDRKRALADLTAHFAGQTPSFQSEHRLRTEAGEWRWVLVRGRVVERAEDGSPLRMAGSHLDITALKTGEAARLELQRQLLQAQKLESLGALAGGIAHDFNNLLATVMGNLELSLLDLPPDSPLRAGLREAHHAAARAAELSRHMLAYSGGDAIVRQPLDLSQVVRGMTASLAAAVPDPIRLAVEPGQACAVVLACEESVRRMVRNLVTNAAEAIGAGPGSIVVRTGVAQYDAASLAGNRAENRAPAGWYAWTEVVDSGSGMDSETVRRLFDPFYTTRFTGRGLGMSVVLGTIRAHRGAIFIDSVEHQGSTVRLLLPLQEQPTPAAGAVPERPADAAERGGNVVVVVDDEPMVRALAVACLRRLGLSAVQFDTAEEALALLDGPADSIGGVLMDVALPGVGGMEACAEIARRRPGLPLVLCSGYDLPPDRPLAEIGVSGFLRKPYTLADFREALLGAGMPLP